MNVLQRNCQERRGSGGGEQGREIQTVAADLVTVLSLLISGGLLRRPVRVDMRNRTHLGNEERQRGQGRDAKLDAMRPIEQGQPLTEKPTDASTVRVNRKPSGRWSRESCGRIRAILLHQIPTPHTELLHTMRRTAPARLLSLAEPRPVN